MPQPVEDVDAGGPAPHKRKRSQSVVCKPKRQTKKQVDPPVGTLEHCFDSIRRLLQEKPDHVARIKELADENKWLTAQHTETQRLLDEEVKEAALLASVNEGLLHPSRLVGDCTNCYEKGQDGVTCSGAAKHAICFRCLAGFAAMDAAPLNMFHINDELQIPCFDCVPVQGWNLVRAIEHAPRESQHKLLSALTNYTNHTTFRTTKLEIARKNVEVPTPLERILMSIEAIVVKTCPGGCVWADHDACLVLHCDACGITFCGLCDGYLSPDKDSHGHVANCKYNPNPGMIFMAQDEFKLLKTRQRRERVFAFIKALDNDFLAAHGPQIFARVDYLLE